MLTVALITTDWQASVVFMRVGAVLVERVCTLQVFLLGHKTLRNDRERYYLTLTVCACRAGEASLENGAICNDIISAYSQVREVRVDFILEVAECFMQ